MPAISASAPGKIILFGEHAVVYGQPAIAVPVHQVQARAIVKAQPGGDGIRIIAPDISLSSSLANLPFEDAVARAIHLTLDALKIPQPPACSLMITSTIPFAAGMGSGAAVSVAIIRALSGFLGHPLPDELVNQIAFEVEKLHHGTPSGIDNTVVTYAKPVYFVKGQQLKTIEIHTPFQLVIGDTGIATPTSETVGDVRKFFQAEPALFQNYFNMCGEIALNAVKSIQQSRITSLGPLMDDNHAILVKMGVSCPELDRLVSAARQAGALGAKLSGGGRGGNMIALVEPERGPQVESALQQAGAVRTILTTVR
jgi:mevalonate kinase